MADSDFSLFIDTNLDTHFAISISPQETVADLKGKIRTEHAVCFPDIGEITVQAMKIRRKASFYHLSDSMTLKSAFEGVKRSRFLHLDLLSTTTVMKSQAEAVTNIVSENRQENRYLLQTEYNKSASESPILNGSQTLPPILSHKLATQASPLLPSTHSCKKLQFDSNVQAVSGSKYINAEVHLHVQEDNVNGKSRLPASEFDNRSDALPKSEDPITEGNAVVRSNFQEKKEVINDQVKKHGREGASIISSKKEKARERDRTLLNDQLIKGTLQHPSAGKKKRKRVKDGSLKPVEDQVTGRIFGSDTCNKGSSGLEMVLFDNSHLEKQETNLVSSEELPTKPSHVDTSSQSPVDNEPKKKRKKHQSKVYHKSPQSSLAGSSVKEMEADIRKQAVEGNDEDFLVSNYTDLEKPTNPTDFMKVGTHKVIDGNNVEVGTIKPSTKLIGSDYTKERFTQNTKTSKQFPSEEVSSVNPEGPLDGSPSDTHKDTRVAVVPNENEDIRDQPETDPGGPANSRRSRKKHKSERLASSKNATLHSAVEHVNEENVEEPIGNHNYLSKESDAEITGRSHQGRRKKGNKSDLPNLLPNTCKNIIDSSAGHIILENRNETSGGHLGHTSKESEEDTVLGEAAAVVSSPNVDAIATSTSIDKRPKHSPKKSGKAEATELPGHMASEAVHSFLKENDKENIQEPLEDISKGKAVGDHEHTGKESKVTAVSGEVAANVAVSATLDSTIPSNSKDRRSKRSRKKSGNTELPRPTISEADSSILQEDGEEPKEPLEDIFNGKSGDDFDLQGKESKGTSVSGEVAGQLDSALVGSTTSLYPNDKKSKHSRKKSGKSVLSREFLKEANEATEEKLKETLPENNKTSGQESKSATIRTKATTLEDAAERSTATLNTTCKSSRLHKKKKSSNAEVVCHSSRLNTCSENEHTHGNLEKEVTSTNESSGINPDETTQDMKYSMLSKIVTAELFHNSSDKHETTQVSTEKVTEEGTKALSEKAPEESGMRTIHNTSRQGSAELIEANHHKELTKPDNDNNNFRHYFPKVTQLSALPAQELPSMGTETEETNKELATRKRKPKLTSEDPTHLLVPSVSDEQDMLGKTLKNINGNSDLVNPSGQLVSEELKPSETHKKRTVKKKRRTDVHSHNTSSELVSPRKLDDDSGNKPHRSASHQEVSKSMDEKTNHAEEKKNSMNTLSKLQSPPGSGSSESNGENTHYQENGHRVVVRKISNKRYSKGTNQSTQSQRKTSLDASPTIFNDAISESSEDEFEINYRGPTLKAAFDNSSASSDSDGDLGGTKRTGLHDTQTYMNSPEAESIVYHQNDKEMDDGRSILQRSSKVKRKGIPLSEILKKTSNFKKAKSTASQSEFDDSESQPVEEIVLETQLE